MSATEVLTLLALVLLVVLIGLLAFSRIRTVRQGHIAVVQSFDRFSRLVTPGLYILWPWEEQLAEIWVAQRVVNELKIPGIFTKGGLLISVMLSYEMELDVEQMSIDQIYYDEQSREDQQVRIFKQILQDVVADAPSLPPPDDPTRPDVLRLLNPLVGPPAKPVLAQLAQQATGELARRGFVITPDSLVLSRLSLPEPIVDALLEWRRSDFTSAARHEFIKRVREAGGTMSDTALVQLLNAIQENPGNIHSIFTTGSMQPDIRVQDDNLSVRMPTTNDQRANSRPAADNRPSAPKESNATATTEGRGDALPLTEDDMATLRSLFD